MITIFRKIKIWWWKYNRDHYWDKVNKNWK